MYAAYRGLDSARNLDQDDWLKMRKGQFVAGIDDGFGNSEANLVGDTDLITAYVFKDYKGLKTFKNKNLRKGKVLSYHILGWMNTLFHLLLKLLPQSWILLITSNER